MRIVMDFTLVEFYVAFCAVAENKIVVRFLPLYLGRRSFKSFCPTSATPGLGFT